jgi:hypothetical protein
MMIRFVMRKQTTERTQLLTAILTFEMTSYLMRDQRILVIKLTVAVVAPDILFLTLFAFATHTNLLI